MARRGTRPNEQEDEQAARRDASARPIVAMAEVVDLRSWRDLYTDRSRSAEIVAPMLPLKRDAVSDGTISTPSVKLMRTITE